MLAGSIGIEGKHKVLLVDDDDVSLELMALMLAHEGHQVFRAHDAGSALEMIAGQTARPDVMLVDLQMPGVSGGQLAEKVRAMEASTPLLLAMSATQAKRQQVSAFDGFLLKPFAMDDLRRALNPAKRKQAFKSRAATAPLPQEPLNMAVVAKLLAMMPAESLTELIAANIADTRASVATLESQPQDAATVVQIAHRIKGGAAMIGATRIARIASTLEAGGDKAAATPIILHDLLDACRELERMLLAGKFKNNQGPRP